MSVVLDSPWAGTNFSPPQALDINTIEQAILAQLKAAIGNTVEVAHYPNKPQTYRLTHRIGAVLTIFAGDDFSDALDTGAVIQERTLRFNVTLMVRDLGWAYGGPASGTSPGAYQIIESIRQALTGFQVPGCRKMYPTRTEFIDGDKEGGVWYYEMTFAVPTVAVEPSTTDDFALFTEGRMLEEGGETTITVGAAPYTFNAQNQIQLPNGNVSGVIVTSQNGLTTYVLGTDYTLDNVNGIITRLTTGAIASGATVEVAYGYSEVVTALAGGGSAPTAPTN